jgi:predicted DNA-binding WGR domain protein
VTPLARVELELVDPARNAKRFYSITVTHDRQLVLFPALQVDALVLVRAWGRLGKRPTVRRTRFTDVPTGTRSAGASCPSAVKRGTSSASRASASPATG